MRRDISLVIGNVRRRPRGQALANLACYPLYLYSPTLVADGSWLESGREANLAVLLSHGDSDAFVRFLSLLEDLRLGPCEHLSTGGVS